MQILQFSIQLFKLTDTQSSASQIIVIALLSLRDLRKRLERSYV